MLMWLDVGQAHEEQTVRTIERMCARWRRTTPDHCFVELRHPTGEWLIQIGQDGSWELRRLTDAAGFVTVATGDTANELERALEGFGVQ